MSIPKYVSLRWKKTVQLADVQDGDSVLDLGCGKEQYLKTLLPENISYVGFDIELGQDLEKGLPGGLDGVLFDVIFLNEFIEHIENFRSLLIECRDHLKPDGRIIISTPCNFRILSGDVWTTVGEDLTHIHCFRKTNMRNLARICGMVVDRIVGTCVRFPPLLYWWTFDSDQTLYSEVLIYRLIRSDGLGV